MKNLLKKNTAVLLIGMLLPEFISYVYNQTHHNDFRFMLQYIGGVIVLLSSAYLLAINIRNIQSQSKKEKNVRYIFMGTAIIFLLYISASLALQYSFRQGVGF